MVQEQRERGASPLWVAIESIVPRIGCEPHPLNEWVKRVKVGSGVREGATASEAPAGQAPGA